MSGTLIGWGYEGQTIEDLLDTLQRWRIDALADVRLMPLSRKRGFSKTKLREAVEAAGVEYVHLRELGNPKDNRAGFALPGEERAAARRRFRDDVLCESTAQEAVAALADRRDRGERVLVMCFEAEEACCHRHEVLAAARSLETAGV